MAKGVQTRTHETRRPSLKLMVTPFVAHPGSIDRHPTPYKGRKPRRGMTEEMETPPGIRFDDTINKRTIDGVEAPNGGTRRAKMQTLRPVSAVPKECGQKKNKDTRHHQKPARSTMERADEPKLPWLVEDPGRPCEGETPPAHRAQGFRCTVAAATNMDRTSYHGYCARVARQCLHGGERHPQASSLSLVIGNQR